jgi:tetratricopeptide (TPR) repeat protein
MSLDHIYLTTKKWLVCALLAAAVLAVFWPALRCGFVDYDDLDYVTSNTHVQHGLNWQAVHWALTTAHAANWHPLTWVSHMLDCQLYGLQPAGHHLTSLLLHLANALLLFLLLNRLTGALWPSAWVAALFALHPLRVESVVWVAERKDVLSSFFWMLTVGAYVRYADQFKVSNPDTFRGNSSVPLPQSSSAKASEAGSNGGQQFKIFYALALLFFAFGLMSKPMLVTLPFVLLLLDYWPLGRLQFGPAFSWRLIAEKIPFLLLAAASSAVTCLVQSHSGVLASLSAVSLGQRLANVPVAYVRYVAKIFWPSGLAVFYGYEHWSFYQVAGALLLLGWMMFFVVRQRRARPYLAVGWLWFLGMLAPTIGLVQVGHQSMADRYTYLPSVGISLMAAWGLRELAARRPWLLKAAATAAVLTLAACAVLTPRQIAFWRNPVALFSRAADISDQDSQTCYNVGCAVMEQGNFVRAARCFERALKVAGKNAPPSFLARTKNNLGCAFLEQGRIPNAISNFESALALQPKFPQAYYNMGRAFLTNGQPDVAVDCFQRALALDSSVAEIHYKLANALLQLGRPAQAIAEYSQTLRLRPGMDEAANNLAWLLATCSDRSLRDAPKAIALARQASAHSHDENPRILGTLAAAYAEAGRFSEAVATAQRAWQLALAQNDPALAAVLQSQLRQYQLGNEPSHP